MLVSTSKNWVHFRGECLIDFFQCPSNGYLRCFQSFAECTEYTHIILHTACHRRSCWVRINWHRMYNFDTHWQAAFQCFHSKAPHIINGISENLPGVLHEQNVGVLLWFVSGARDWSDWLRIVSNEDGTGMFRHLDSCHRLALKAWEGFNFF